MEKPLLIVLFGNTLFVAGVEASLRDRSGLRVEQVYGERADAWQQLQALEPDVIIFDSSDTYLTTLPGVAQLLRDNEDMMVISLDLNRNDEVTVFSTEQHRVTKADELVDAIRSYVHSLDEAPSCTKGI